MVTLFRHRQPKGAAPVKPHLSPPRHIPTLPLADLAPVLPNPDCPRMSRIIARRRLGHSKHDHPQRLLGRHLAGGRSDEGAGQRRDRTLNPWGPQCGAEIIENGLKMVDRIAVAEPGRQGKGTPDVRSIAGQVAPVGAKVQHLADNAGEHK